MLKAGPCLPFRITLAGELAIMEVTQFIHLAKTKFSQAVEKIWQVDRIKSFCFIKLEEDHWNFESVKFFYHIIDKKKVVLYVYPLNEGTLIFGYQLAIVVVSAPIYLLGV